MSDYVSELEQELLRAGRAHQLSRGRGRRRRFDLGAIVATVSVVTALAIAAVAVVVLHHGHSRARSQGVGGPGSLLPSTGPSLLAHLAILHRPQTAADRRLLSRFAKLTVGGGQIILDLTRLAVTTQSGVRVYVVVVAQRTGSNTVMTPGLVAVDGTQIADTAQRALTAFGYWMEIVPDGERLVAWPYGLTAARGAIGANVAIAKLLGGVAFPGLRPPRLDVTPQITTTPSISPTTSGSSGRAKLLEQINLSVPPGHRARHHEAGVAQIISQGRARGIVIVAQDVPANTAHDAYAIWLCRQRRSCTMLGFVDQRIRATGRLEAEGQLPADAARDTRIVIALQTNTKPTAPGPITLEGRLSPRP